MKFPKVHLVIIGIISLSLGSLVVAKLQDPADARYSSDTVLLDLPNAQGAAQAPPSEAEQLSSATSVDANVATSSEEVQPQLQVHTVQANPQWRTINTKVQPGDNLALIFKRHGLSARDVYLVTQSEGLGKRLKQIYPGHELQFKVNEDNQLMALTYTSGPLDAVDYYREGDQFVAQQITKQPDRQLAYKHGTIDHSLFVASQRAGLSDNLTMRLAQIFQWDVDFVLDIRPGDQFFVLYEELFLEGNYIGDGNILAAEFVNQGEHYRGMLYENTNGEDDYYAPSGESMRKAFLRAPVEFSRISSSFNLRRVHPLFKTVRPHRGIDYAAPTGTPILAAGDGRITKAGRTKPNGNYVVIQHGEQFVTKYLHLSKFARGVRSGSKVSQGQVIGYVGATGWATAPHLHYEFLVNGVHKNPRTVSLPDAEPINSNEMPRFKAQTAQMAALLSSYKQQITLLSAR